MGAKIDFAALDALELHGKVGIDGCKVAQGARHASRRSPASRVDRRRASRCRRRRAPARAGETETLSVRHRPRQPRLRAVRSDLAVPRQLDHDHRGQRLLQAPRLGHLRVQERAAARTWRAAGSASAPSSITMQMVKNVLLSQEKTLSRKLQELFFVWYLEQELPKERILELYFNAIEFGPRIYGIGRGGAALLRQEALRAEPGRGGVLLVDPAQPQAALHPVLPRGALSAVGQVRAPHRGQGPRARPAHRRGVRPGARSRWSSIATRRPSPRSSASTGSRTWRPGRARGAARSRGRRRRRRGRGAGRRSGSASCSPTRPRAASCRPRSRPRARSERRPRRGPPARSRRRRRPPAGAGWRVGGLWLELGRMAPPSCKPIAFITGANRGIGLALCRRLQEKGREVIAVCRESSRRSIARGAGRGRHRRHLRRRDSRARAAARGGRALRAGLQRGHPARRRPRGRQLRRRARQPEVNALGPLRVVKALRGNLGKGAKSR